MLTPHATDSSGKFSIADKFYNGLQMEKKDIHFATRFEVI